jgi:hypothetical protein
MEPVKCVHHNGPEQAGREVSQMFNSRIQEQNQNGTPGMLIMPGVSVIQFALSRNPTAAA